MVDEGKLAEVLAEFARTLTSDYSIQGILNRFVARVVEVLPVSAAGITLISAEAGPRYIAASKWQALQFEQLQDDLREGPCLAAFTSGAMVVVGDLSCDETFPRFAPAAVSAGLGAVFALPLHHGDTRIGALDLYRDDPGELTGHDLEVAQTLADVAAAYLLNAQTREADRAASARFEHQALHDSLTGLPNRALLQQRLAHAAQRAHRSHTHAAVFFFDLDGFKQVNDAHGHHVGDQLLIAVASRLAAIVRPGDTLARFAGDEFVVLCEDVRYPGDAEALGDRFHETLTDPFPLADRTVAITGSVGLAFAGPAEDVSDQLLVEADKAMYRVKHRGGASRHVVDLREPLDPGAPNEEVDPRFASGWLLARSVAQQQAVAGDELVQRHTATAQLARMVDHDALTGLANRSLFLDRLEQARAACRLSAVPFAVVYLDLDGFKHVNDGLGHDAGDEVLQGLAHRLRQVVGPGDTVARFGGDEFAVLCPDVADEPAASAVAERIRNVLAEEFHTTQGAVTLTASVGIALGDAASDGSGLLRDVDTAMYAAKAAGRNRVEAFDAEMQAKACHRFRMVTTLQTALDDDGVEVFYQPTIELATGRIVGVEALARLRASDGALIAPNEVIPVAEQAGLIAALGERVLWRACCDARPWIAADPAFMLSVNLSPCQLTRSDVTGTIDSILAETGLAPASLWLEVTESALLSGPAGIAAISRLRQSGIRFAIDDFGTGYSSLAHLRQTPVDMLKIDRSFVKRMHADIQDHALVAATVHLARAFKLPSTAEGVETTEQLAELNQLGCDYAQGYLWSPAVEAHAIPALLTVPPTRSLVGALAGPERPQPVSVTACPTPAPKGSP